MYATALVRSLWRSRHIHLHLDSLNRFYASAARLSLMETGLLRPRNREDAFSNYPWSSSSYQQGREFFERVGMFICAINERRIINCRAMGAAAVRIDEKDCNYIFKMPCKTMIENRKRTDNFLWLMLKFSIARILSRSYKWSQLPKWNGFMEHERIKKTVVLFFSSLIIIP